MNAARWSLIRKLYHCAVEMPAAERTAFLATVPTADADVRREVESLLFANDRVGSFLNVPPTGESSRFDYPELLAVGTKIRGYTLRGVLGFGGMGVVYRADQEAPRRSVALKLIRPDLVSDRVVAQFRSEANLLGRLQHPGIAQIIEFGTYAAPSANDIGPVEHPYLVMERVEGPPITRYAREHGLSIEARLALFVRLCNALGHAHRRGVLHLDIKPSNVLVSAPDDRPETAQPKVLDFGTAKAIGPGIDPNPLDIGFTPGYASPEQTGEKAARLDCRADVYALGIVLSKLLDDDPATASSARETEARGGVADGGWPRGSDSVVVRSRTDLEAILAKATSIDRDSRYASCRDFAEDVARYLQTEPVRARPRSTPYVLRSFAAPVASRRLWLFA